MFTMINLVVLLSFLGSIANCQTISKGSCPEVTTEENFDLGRYMGRWYELERYPNKFQKGDCGVAKYVLQSDGTVFVNNTELKEDGTIGTAIGEARFDPESPILSHLQVRFSKRAPWAKYWVLDTDYTSYSVVYSCRGYILNRVETLWILARGTSLPSEMRQQISQLLKKFKIDETKLRIANQSQAKCAILQKNE